MLSSFEFCHRFGVYIFLPHFSVFWEGSRPLPANGMFDASSAPFLLLECEGGDEAACSHLTDHSSA